MLDPIRIKMDIQAFNLVLTDIWATVRKANAYVDAQAPWALKTEDPKRMRTVLYVLAETIRNLALLTNSFLPFASEKIFDQLSISSNKRLLSFYGKKSVLSPGINIPKPAGIFPRYHNDQ